MITEQKTSRYNVNPQKLIENSFVTAYDSNNDAPVIYPPDLAVTVTSVISLLMICGMCVLTWYLDESRPVIWLGVGAVFIIIMFFVIRNHVKKQKTYLEANSKGGQKFDYKSEYISLFPDLPSSISASDFSLKIATMQNKQKKDVYNNAIRNLVTKLNQVNNPGDILCKNLTTYGTLMTQLKHRWYLKMDDGNFVIYDADFQKPLGELVMDFSDVVSYGTPDTFDTSEITKNGTKISQDALLVEIKTGSSEKDRLFLEVHSREYDRLKKMLGGKKK